MRKVEKKMEQSNPVWLYGCLRIGLSSGITPQARGSSKGQSKTGPFKIQKIYTHTSKYTGEGMGAYSRSDHSRVNNNRNMQCIGYFQQEELSNMGFLPTSCQKQLQIQMLESLVLVVGTLAPKECESASLSLPNTKDFY